MDINATVASLLATGINPDELIATVQVEAERASRNKQLNKVRSDLCLAIINYVKEIEPEVSFSAEERKSLEEAILSFEQEFTKLWALRKEIPTKSDPKRTIHYFLKTRGLAD